MNLKMLIIIHVIKLLRRCMKMEEKKSKTFKVIEIQEVHNGYEVIDRTTDINRVQIKMRHFVFNKCDKGLMEIFVHKLLRGEE